MKTQRYFLLLLLGLLVAILGSLWIDVPGYMDADYYHATGLAIADGDGFNEHFIWNYLNEPEGIPNPSHQYWMPSTSLLAGLSMAIFGRGFKSAQILFILVTAFVPVVTAGIAFNFHKNEKFAWFSGLFAVFSGFFFPYMVTTDTFTIYMIIGAGAFWFMSQAVAKSQVYVWIVVGLFVGIAQLSRADGILVLGIATLTALLAGKNRIRATLFLLCGYIIIMLPWWMHNYEVTGSIMSASSTKVLWTLSYDELFSYSPENLTFERWWSSGVFELIKVRIDALIHNIKSLFVVNGLIFLGPFMIIGAILNKNHPLVRLAAGYLFLLIITMSFIFPFAGARGGYFHSSSAVMPVLWTLAPVGLFEAIRFGANKRGWDLKGASRVFGSAAVVIAMLTTAGLYYLRVIGPETAENNWGSSHVIYESVGRWFSDSGREDHRVAVNNPPGLFVASGMESVVIPNGGVDELREVLVRYRVDWVILDQNNPGLAELIENPNLVTWLIHEGTLEPINGSQIQIYRVDINE